MGILHSEEEIVYHFFTETEFFTESEAVITGPDVNHIKNVLRMKPGEKLLLSDGKGTNCLCEITELFPDKVLAKILPEEVDDTELPVKVTLYQGLPKADKMELIIQKAVELGAFSIIPVETKRCVVKLDVKKAAKKVVRWQQIAESAAKQSKRMLIPEIHEVMTYKQALEFAKQLDVKLIPYELAKGMKETREILSEIKPGQSVGIFIGPEGGFEEEEVAKALEAGAHAITLGRRILRTETAGLAILSVLMFQLENE